MKTWVITCTGDRPEALRLCNHYMARQTHQDFTWIVVSDVFEETPGPRRADLFIGREPCWEPGEITLPQNLLAGLEAVDTSEPGIVLIVEDDDWYSGGYIGNMHSIAENLPPQIMLFGESRTRYYNVRWRTYRHNDNDKWASLCSMGFKTEFIPEMRKMIEECDPDRPFIDVAAFQKHRSRAYLQPTDLVCGIKGMPGRRGIGHGHTEACKRLRRDPYLEVLQDWIGTDVERYRDFYHDEEMRDVPIHIEDRMAPWVLNEARLKNDGKAGICVYFRQPGVTPDLSHFAAGTFAHGYLNEMRDIADARLSHFPPADLTVISGGALRHGGLNGVVFDHYRTLGTPVIICDPGRVVPRTQRIYINKEHWLPPIDCPKDRLEPLGLEYAPRPRGTKILVVGQRADLDNQLRPALETMRGVSDRQIIFRPHPNTYHPHEREAYDLPYDRVAIGGDKIDSRSQQTLTEALDDAWVVVTHSSIVGAQALMRGIPVFCHDDAVFANAGLPLDQEVAIHLESIDRPHWAQMDVFLRRWSYTIWYEKELRSGKAFDFLKQFIRGDDATDDQL